MGNVGTVVRADRDHAKKEEKEKEEERVQTEGRK